VLVFVAVLLVSFLVARVVDVQGLGAAKYAAYGNSELYQKVTLPALRGSIYDRNGNLIAVSVPRVDVVSDDFLVSDPNTDLAALARLLGLSPSVLHNDLTQKRGYVTLARQVATATEAAVGALDLPNVSFVPDPTRVDPDGLLFSPLLGIVGFSGTGLSGLEYQRQNLLQGVPGSEELAVGPAGEALPSGARDIEPATQGEGLVLSLDQPLQFEVTRVLSAQLKATDAHSGTVVVLDTRTGGILSMVNLVRNRRGQVSPATQNLAVTSQYQAGSVMKLATISAALQDGVISPSSRFTVPFTINVGGWQFEDADYHPTEVLPVAQILAQSSNVGTIEIAADLGPQRLYDQLRDLGFGQPTALDWPGETAGDVPPLSTWWASSMGTIPIGTGEAVTAMQVADAYNAVANGGVYVPPRLVQATVSPDGTQKVVPSGPTHRVLDAATARELLPMLECVTSAGTATAAQIPGYTVAGKTGTAQIPNGRGGYTPGAWMATFVGFVPAQSPQLTAIVVINHPNDYYGGAASAPVFSTIMRYALRHFDVSPPASTAGGRACQP
jgi:cell division protein FtsI (penicillin-binding protein 3)